MAKKKLTRHHICPRSRMEEVGIEANELNLVRWDETFHQRWHVLFDNMTPDEIINFIRIITMPGYEWTAADIEQQKALIMSCSRLVVGSRGS